MFPSFGTIFLIEDMTLLQFVGNHMICMNCAYLESSLIALTLIKMTKNEKFKNDNFRQFVFCFWGGFFVYL